MVFTYDRFEALPMVDQPFSSSTKVVPSAAGLGETRMPADFIASILEFASPLPPEMIAPA